MHIIYSAYYGRAEADQYDEGDVPPVFGRSDAEYSVVAKFYAFWGHFSSRLTFAWEVSTATCWCTKQCYVALLESATCRNPCSLYMY
jgi:hypothetical protein